MALIAVVVTLALVIGLTARDYKLLGPDGVLLATLMWLIAPVFALLRFRWMGWSYEKALWSIAVFFLWIAICGLGRPGLLLNKLFKDDSKISQRILLRSIIGQASLVLGIIILSIVVTFFV
ncbi:hypothetical protein [Actinoallomurus soli]|uniref:hypothetical protein n=1 Tax=Actinoallomurus soli TaxID=2952535 RepID=UPI002091F82B|nr:hypothetical protein [Actinoallomurus soli]MCO5974831.1 hypothetical protein [Actinoallomurus soli]